MTRTIKDLTNIKFGRLVALEPTNIRHDSKVVWKCICDCGKECYVVSRSLVTGNTKSCGCLNKENLQRGITKLEDGIANFNQLFSSYKRNADIRKLFFDISSVAIVDILGTRSV